MSKVSPYQEASHTNTAQSLRKTAEYWIRKAYILTSRGR